jgi:hypothetical protein
LELYGADQRNDPIRRALGRDPYVNREEALTAAVFFAAHCDIAGGAVERRAGYAITNAEPLQRPDQDPEQGDDV